MRLGSTWLKSPGLPVVVALGPAVLLASRDLRRAAGSRSLALLPPPAAIFLPLSAAIAASSSSSVVAVFSISAGGGEGKGERFLGVLAADFSLTGLLGANLGLLGTNLQGKIGLEERFLGFEALLSRRSRGVG